VFGALFSPETPESLPGIYNFLVDCTNTAADSVESFPVQYAQWKDGCYLDGPLDGKLTQPSSKENHVSFKLKVPHAVGVVVIVGPAGSEWILLKKNEEDMWEGEVDMAKVWETNARVAVSATYQGSADTYSTLLEYTT